MNDIIISICICEESDAQRIYAIVQGHQLRELDSQSINIKLCL